MITPACKQGAKVLSSHVTGPASLSLLGICLRYWFHPNKPIPFICIENASLHLINLATLPVSTLQVVTTLQSSQQTRTDALRCAAMMATPLPPPTPLQQTPPVPSISQALENIVRAAATRADEGQQIFGPIAALWDEYLQTEAVRKLPTRLRRPLTALCNEISAVANKHFDAYIKGAHPPRTAAPKLGPNTSTNAHASTSASSPSPPSGSTPLQDTHPTSYAQAVATGTPAQARTTPAQKTSKKKDTTPRPDTRLFVRIDPGHSARAAGPFAVLTALKNRLGEDSALLKEVQEVKSGFALCTDSLEALAALEKHTESIARLFSDCTVERQPIWTTYRLTNVPRTVNTLDGLGSIVSNQVTEEILSRTTYDLIRQRPTRITETNESVQDNLFNTSWLMSFNTETHQPLPRTLRILGASVNVSWVKPRHKTIQCTKCYQWHNARSCSRAQCCRICGSNKHSEDNHSTHCATASPHTCPARCLHCGGPHPADNVRCPLRLTSKGPKTRAEQQAIMESSKAARKRACAAAGCSRAPDTDTQMDARPVTPQTPARELPQAAPPTTPATRFFTAETTNRFTPLSLNV